MSYLQNKERLAHGRRPATSALWALEAYHDGPHPSVAGFAQPGGIKASLFPPSSRYRGSRRPPGASDGRTIMYLRRRFCPRRALRAAARARRGTGRPGGHVTAQHIGDPEQFWRVCDGDGGMHPYEITETIGRRVRITLPEGLPGSR